MAYDMHPPSHQWQVTVDRVNRLKGYQRLNHFPGMLEICRKVRSRGAAAVSGHEPRAGAGPSECGSQWRAM